MVNMTQIRPATPADIPTLTDLWYERALLQQSRLLPDARERWASAACAWLERPDMALLVAENDAAQVIGYVVGRVQDAAPGKDPEREGVITEIAVDAHRYTGGAARLLAEAIREWFSVREIGQILILVSLRSPVEQAFWRSLGAIKRMEVLWIKS